MRKIIYISLSILICSVTTLLAQNKLKSVKVEVSINNIKSERGDTIYYSTSRPLKWADFIGTPKVQGRSAAVSFTGFGYQARISNRNDSIVIKIMIDVFFQKSASWVLPGYSNPYVLSHEQLHFDIARIAAETFKKELLARKDFNFDDADSIMQFEYLEAYRVMNRLQSQYDNETRNGLDKVAQAKWQTNIKEDIARIVR